MTDTTRADALRDSLTGANKWPAQVICDNALRGINPPLHDAPQRTAEVAPATVTPATTTAPARGPVDDAAC